MKEIQEEKFFQKEFAKEVRKINTQQNNKHKNPKKNEDLVDKLIDGEMNLGDFIQQMETKLKEKKLKGKNKNTTN